MLAALWNRNVNPRSLVGRDLDQMAHFLPACPRLPNKID